MLHYWMRVTIRALHATQPEWKGRTPRSWLGSLIRLAAIYAIAAYLLFRFVGVLEVIDEGRVIGVLLLAALTVWVLHFLWNFINAPLRMADEAQGDLLALLEENRRLESERIPGISVIAQTGRRNGGIGPHLMWAALEVTNTSPSQHLSDVQARIIGCEHIAPSQDTPGQYRNLSQALFDWTPIYLQWGQAETTAIEIPAGSSRTLLVAFSDDTNGPGGAVFSDAHRTRVMLELKILIEVSGRETAVWRGAFFICCHPKYWNGQEARFEFEPWDEWVPTRTVIDRGAIDAASPVGERQMERDARG